MTRPNHDDPRLTAYALGELSPGEAAEVEALLADSADARAAVEEIRGITHELSDRLSAEAAPVLTSAQRTAIMKGSPKPTPQRQPAAAGRPGKSSTVVIGACLMVLLAGAVVMFSEKQTDSPKQRVILIDGDSSMIGGSRRDDLKKAYVTAPPRDSQPFAGDGQKGRGDNGKDTKSDGSSVVNKSPNGDQGNKSGSSSKGGQGQGQGKGQGHGNSPFPTPGNPVKKPTVGKIVSGLHGNGQQQQGQRPLYPRYYRPALGLRFHKKNTSSPANESRILGGKWRGRGLAGGTVTGQLLPRTYGYDGYGIMKETHRFGLQPGFGGFGRPAREYERLAKLSDKAKYYYDDIDGKKPGKSSKPGEGGAAGNPKDGITTGPKQVKPVHFKAGDVAQYRKNIGLYFDQLSRQLPKREMTVLRVKQRVTGKLALLEQHVGALEKAGKKLEVAKGEELVVKVLDAELGDVDLDGDGRKDFRNESYDTIVENEFLTPLADPLSTFSIDVDTASYSNVRRFLTQGQLPPRNAVRIEELINYFNYDYPDTKTKDPFSVTLETGICPWNPKHRLVLIGLKGRELPHDKRPPANLVFLIDVSGSMSSAKKLPLVQLSLQMLVDQMQAKDRISIVTYASSAKIVLEPTSGDKKDEIIKKIHSLRAGGGTNGSSGIQMAYEQAQKAFVKNGANRVILCTDGDFNVGVSSDNELVKLIQEKAKTKVFLSVFGYGMGNYKGSKLQKIADKGNGNHGYIDNFNEAKKVFIEEMTGTLYTIAKDVKIQVEFNPGIVSSYRLVGYENRMLAAQDFNNDKKDAGEIGAGHTVTALYEIVPKSVGGKVKKPTVDALKYQKRVKVTKANPVSQEMLTVKLRYKQPDKDKSVKIEFPLKDSGDKKAAPSENLDWASAVAMYGLLLRESKHAGDANLELVRELATGSMGKDPEGHRSEFLKLVHRTRTFVARKLGRPVPAPRALEAGAAK